MGFPSSGDFDLVREASELGLLLLGGAGSFLLPRRCDLPHRPLYIHTERCVGKTLGRRGYILCCPVRTYI